MYEETGIDQLPTVTTLCSSSGVKCYECQKECKSLPSNPEGRRLRKGVCFVGREGYPIRYLVNQGMPDEAGFERGTWRVGEYGC
jgi:hypothetical protein